MKILNEDSLYLVKTHELTNDKKIKSEDAKKKATPKPVKKPEPNEPTDTENECEAKATNST